MLVVNHHIFSSKTYEQQPEPLSLVTMRCDANNDYLFPPFIQKKRAVNVFAWLSMMSICRFSQCCRFPIERLNGKFKGSQVLSGAMFSSDFLVNSQVPKKQCDGTPVHSPID